MRANILNAGSALGLIFVLMICLVIPNYAFSMTVEKGKLYFVGVGPAGPDLATLQAIDVIRQADVIFAPSFGQRYSS